MIVSLILASDQPRPETDRLRLLRQFVEARHVRVRHERIRVLAVVVVAVLAAMIAAVAAATWFGGG